MPTYDELAGAGLTAAAFSDHILASLHPDRLNVYTVHAEVEGIVMAAEFGRFLKRACENDIGFAPLGTLLPDAPYELPSGRLRRGSVRGREGWLGVQA